MTEKDKIANILNSTEISHELSKDDIYKFADALIAAGYGNVEEVEHRAVVTERALLVACDDIKGLCRYLYEIEKITKAITIKCYHPEKIVPREYIVIAEKELAEEKKDANRI